MRRLDGRRWQLAIEHGRIILSSMSVAEIKQAVRSLSPMELAELSAFIADCDAQTWDRQIDADFSDDGRLRVVLDEVRADMRAGRLEQLP